MTKKHQISACALHSALCSAYRRKLLNDEPTTSLIASIVIAYETYHKLNTGQITKEECKYAIESCFDHKQEMEKMTPVF